MTAVIKDTSCTYSNNRNECRLVDNDNRNECRLVYDNNQNECH
jgi:hypothetical protein